jgi:hypothetical protein
LDNNLSNRRADDLISLEPNSHCVVYSVYQRLAHEADTRMRMFNKNLDTSLLLVSNPSPDCTPRIDPRGLQAGLFATICFGSILDIRSRFLPNQDKAVVAYLKILINTLDSSKYPDTENSIPDSHSPPAIQNVQALLYTSLTFSLLSVFMAKLGKQCIC